MSNAAVIVNKILRMRSALSREETGSARLFRIRMTGLMPHVINGKGNGIRY